MKRAALMLLVLALAGCGSGGGKGDPAATASQPGDVAANQRELDLQIAYDNGIKACTQYTMKDAAEIYGVKAEPKAIADAVAKAEADAELQAQARKGCLDAFK